MTPEGEIEETPYRGMWMGNRGDLHSGDGGLGLRRWRNKRWITCTLDPGKGRGVTFDAPGRYYPLFFYDEAVALAAGHRPCAHCRRPAFNRFFSAWQSASVCGSAAELDAALHHSRLDSKNQRRFEARLCDLPQGVFVAGLEVGASPLLLWNDRLFPWSHAGYEKAIKIGPTQRVNVLTPMAIVATLNAGYVIRPRLDQQLANIDGYAS